MGTSPVRGPWKRIGRVLDADPAEIRWECHPAPRVLRAYLRDALPPLPERWTGDQAEALLSGRIASWTAWDVVAHVASCPRCRAQLHRLETRSAWRNWLPSIDWTPLVQRPKLARVGWILAGAQALALLGLIVWIGFFRSSPVPPKAFQPLLGFDQLPQMVSDVPQVQDVYVQLAPEAQLEEVAKLAAGLRATIGGPDNDGYYYLLVPEGVAVSIEELKTHSIVNDVRDGEAR